MRVNNSSRLTLAVKRPIDDTAEAGLKKRSAQVRIRYYGFLANRHRNERLEQCRRLLGVTSGATSTTKESQTPLENSDPAPSPKTCPACGLQSLVIIEVVPATLPLPLRRPYFLTDRTVNFNCFDTS